MTLDFSLFPMIENTRVTKTIKQLRKTETNKCRATVFYNIIDYNLFIFIVGIFKTIIIIGNESYIRT